MREDEQGEPCAGRALVVVPMRPGPLLDLPTEIPRQRDELDELLDDVFGEPTREGPGLLDIVLITGGFALAVAAELAHLSMAVAVLGATMAGLGLVLPARALWQRRARRRAKHRVDEVLQQGLPLNLGDPATTQLAAIYQRVVELSAATDAVGADALEAAHLAMVEVADLVGGRPPRGAAEKEYVLTRVRALENLAQVLVQPSPSIVDQNEDAGSAVRDAAVAAIRQLEERSGGGSVARIEAVRMLLGRGKT